MPATAPDVALCGDFRVLCRTRVPRVGRRRQPPPRRAHTYVTLSLFPNGAPVGIRRRRKLASPNACRRVAASRAWLPPLSSARLVLDHPDAGQHNRRPIRELGNQLEAAAKPFDVLAHRRQQQVAALLEPRDLILSDVERRGETRPVCLCARRRSRSDISSAINSAARVSTFWRRTAPSAAIFSSSVFRAPLPFPLHPSHMLVESRVRDSDLLAVEPLRTPTRCIACHQEHGTSRRVEGHAARRRPRRTNCHE